VRAFRGAGADDALADDALKEGHVGRAGTLGVAPRARTRA
jgi:hypothetical protein